MSVLSAHPSPLWSLKLSYHTAIFSPRESLECIDSSIDWGLGVISMLSVLPHCGRMSTYELTKRDKAWTDNRSNYICNHAGETNPNKARDYGILHN